MVASEFEKGTNSPSDTGNSFRPESSEKHSSLRTNLRSCSFSSLLRFSYENGTVLRTERTSEGVTSVINCSKS